MDARLMEKLQKVMALAKSGVEGEAQAAAAILAKMLTEHNLSIADLEKKGAHAPSVAEKGHDLGKAAFTWKLDLAEAIAAFYYCHPMIDRRTKSVAFIGRPDNVEALTMLYAWLMKQVADIAREERRAHFDKTQEHVDPLRWQVNFGIGAVRRLRDRLDEEKTRREEDMARNDLGEVTALVVHHDTENQDFLEGKYGFRTDGRETKAERESRERYEKEREARKAWLARDPEGYYAEYPWEKPETDEEKAARTAREAKANEEYRKREERNRKRRDNYVPKYREEREESDEEYRQRQQARSARASGEQAASRINLQPFLKGEVPTDAPKLPKK